VIDLPPLPYAYDSLEPCISERTLRFHHDKHHRAYVDKTNELIAGSRFESAPLETLIREARAEPYHQDLFNQAAQAWNHAFFWRSLSPRGGDPEGTLASLVERDFGGIEGLRERLVDAAVGQFGSGWAWLVLTGDRLDVRSTSDAEPPFSDAPDVPLLTLDVWEHAYYLDYQNERAEYAKAVVGGLLNWEFAAENLRTAR
jgi:Fe-Mn family superoxide dismutase